MTPRRRLSFAILFSGFALILIAQAPPATAGDLEDLSSKIRILERAAPGGDAEKKLLREIRVLGGRLRGKAVPQSVRRHMARGEAFVELATDAGGFAKAAAEFKAAIRAAPWMAANHYNLGVVQDKAGQYAAAINSLKTYLALASGAADARDVEKLIFKIEVRSEEAAKRNQAEQARQAKIRRRQRAATQRRKQAARRQEQRRRAASRISGAWYFDLVNNRYWYQIEVNGNNVSIYYTGECAGCSRPVKSRSQLAFRGAPCKATGCPAVPR